MILKNMDNLEHTVLIVDDNEDNRVVLQRRLERRGLHVVSAENGLQALECLRSNKFDLVLLDIMMPVMNGYQVLEQMNIDPKLRHVPVIVISGLDDMDSIVKCIELGAEDYLLKPFNRTLLNARINASLEKKRLHDQEEVYLQQIKNYSMQLEQRVEEHIRELKMARRVQVSLLPESPPPSDEWEFAVRWFPAKEIAGDYYDFIPTEDGQLRLIVGDVTDKGLPASLFMVFARHCMRSSIPIGATPAKVVEQANRLICTESTHGLYISLVYARLSAADGVITYVNAGLNSPLMFCNASRELCELQVTGMALGVSLDAQFDEERIQLSTGDFIVFYTDGVTDALNANNEAYGLERLQKEIMENHEKPANEIMKELEESITTFVGAASWFDDITIVITKKL